MYTTVLFDLDHTLLDSEASQLMAYQDVMRAFEINEPDSHFDAYERINAELWAEVETGDLGPNDVRHLRFTRFVQERGLDRDPIAMADRYVDGLGRFGELYAGAEAVLDAIAPFARLGMVSNGIGEVQRSRIERLGLAHRFETIVISGEVGTAKPGAAIFELAFTAMPGADRSAAVMVGDSLSSDIAGGVNAGIATCWYDRNGPTEPPSSINPRPTHRITDLSELLTIVRDVSSGGRD